MAQTKWYYDEAVDQSPIISSRIRLARNLKKYPFSIKIDDERSERMISEVVGAIKNDHISIADQFEYIDLNQMNDIDKQAMVEKHEISLELLKYSRPRGLLLKDDESVGIMLNEEDHIRIQTLYPGKNIGKALDMADKIDNLLEETVEYAFDKDFGYLTSCPSNTGTGLRASYMAHIPMLERTGRIPSLVSSLSKFGMTIRGIYGEGSESAGSIYQISNQITLGKNEEEILRALESIASQIVESELNTFESVRAKQPVLVEDQIYRSLGILKTARQINMKEAMGLLSAIRLGYMTGILKADRPQLPVYSIIMDIEPGNLQKRFQKPMGENERNSARAEYLRDIFKNING